MQYYVMPDIEHHVRQNYTGINTLMEEHREGLISSLTMGSVDLAAKVLFLNSRRHARRWPDTLEINNWAEILLLYAVPIHLMPGSDLDLNNTHRFTDTYVNLPRFLELPSPVVVAQLPDAVKEVREQAQGFYSLLPSELTWQRLLPDPNQRKSSES